MKKTKIYVAFLLSVFLISALNFQVTSGISADFALSESFEGWNENDWGLEDNGNLFPEDPFSAYTGNCGLRVNETGSDPEVIYNYFESGELDVFYSSFYVRPNDLNLGSPTTEYELARYLNYGEDVEGAISIRKPSSYYFTVLAFGGSGLVLTDLAITEGNWYFVQFWQIATATGYARCVVTEVSTGNSDYMDTGVSDYSDEDGIWIFELGKANVDSVSAFDLSFDNYYAGYDLSVTADLEPDNSGADWVFTDWRHYTFTASVPSTEVSYFYIGFTELVCFNGTLNSVVWCDGESWLAETSYIYLGRDVDAIRVDAGSWSESAGSTTITFPIWFTSACLDIWLDDDAVDVLCWYNTTDGTESGWVTVQSNYFRVYNDGGFSTYYSYTGDPGESGTLPGGRDFSMFAYNGSYAYKNMIWRDLQHIKLQPTVHFRAGLETFYLWYDFHFMTMDGNWHTGLTLQLEPDFVSYTGVFASNVWINMSASWYYNNSLIKEDDLYMFYHGDVYTATDFGRWSFWIDFWFDVSNASSTMGGRINAYEFPMNDNSAVWFRWLSSNWGIKDDVLKQSECMVPLLDSDGNLLSSEQIQFVKVSASLSVTDLDSGQLVSIPEYNTFDTTNGGSPLRGISTPPWDETQMPAMKNTGVLGAIWSMFEGIGKWLSENIIFGGLNLWGTFVAFLDTIAGWLGAPYFFTNLFNYIGELFGNFISGVGYVLELVYQFFLLIGEFLGAFITTLGELIVSVANTVSGILDIMGGAIGGAGNLWETLGISTWLTVAMVFYPIYLIILWEERGMDAVVAQLTMIFGIASWLFFFFKDLILIVINFITGLIESIPVAE